MCGEKMDVVIASGFTGKVIQVRCGSTSPDGNPWLCDKCEVLHKGRNWRREAEEAGEQWDDDY